MPETIDTELSASKLIAKRSSRKDNGQFAKQIHCISCNDLGKFF